MTVVKFEPPLLALLFLRRCTSTILFLQFIVGSDPEEPGLGGLREVDRAELLGMARRVSERVYKGRIRKRLPHVPCLVLVIAVNDAVAPVALALTIFTLITLSTNPVAAAQELCRPFAG